MTKQNPEKDPVTAVIVHLALHEGATEHVSTLIEVMIGFSAGLLGISSVTGVFKNKNNND